MHPTAYFYVVDSATRRPVAIFSSEHCRSGAELEAYEDRLRTERQVDGTRLILKSSHTAPLPVETVERLLSTIGGTNAADRSA
jgi:hypothetical protein